MNILPEIPDLSTLDDDALLALIEQVKAAIPEDEIKATMLEARAAIARERDDPEGFGHFFFCITGNELAPYAREYWVPEIYAAHADNTGVLLEAFRGSTKSTIGMCFDLFRIGHNPKGSGLIIGANDTAAGKISSFLAVVIEYLPGWKRCFPWLVPDKARGWGAEGYFIKDTREDYARWIELTTQDHGRDPSFVAFGVTSSNVPGMHPSSYLHVDDIHDRANTSSPREMEAVKDSVRKNILPVMSRPGLRPFMHFEYTPWANDDSYQMMEETEFFHHIKTPLYVDDDDGVEYDEKHVKFANWPGVVGPKFADDWKKILNDRATYFLMMLLDKEGAQRERVFRYYPYRSELINMGWPMVAGVDYASVYNPTAGNPDGRSHFALCYGLKTPENGIVIADGIVEQCTQRDGEEYVMNAQRLFQGWLNCVVETDGKGMEFYQLLARNPKLKVLPKSTGGKRKADRLYRFMSPWLENGKVRISDRDSKFLNLARSFFDKFPRIPQHDPEWDVADSIYYTLLGMPDMLFVPKTAEQQEQERRAASANPWAKAGRVLGGIH